MIDHSDYVFFQQNPDLQRTSNTHRGLMWRDKFWGDALAAHPPTTSSLADGPTNNNDQERPEINLKINGKLKDNNLEEVAGGAEQPVHNQHQLASNVMSGTDKCIYLQGHLPTS